MTTKFKNAIDALVHAFFNETLAAGTCCACACANIIAHQAGVKIEDYWGDIDISRNGANLLLSDWRYLYPTYKELHKKEDPNRLVKAQAVIGLTGYSVDDFFKIESAFEGATRINVSEYKYQSRDEIIKDQYNGLMAVLDVLCEIEGIENPAEYKELFSYAQP